MALYPYTLRPIDVHLTDAEFRQAQAQLFASNEQSLARISTKTWVIVGVLVAVAIAGIILVHGYSTLIFWLLLVGVAVFLLIRTVGLRWYVKKEFDKQAASQTMPPELAQLKLGIQSHGIILGLPAPDAAPQKNTSKRKGSGMHQPLIRQSALQQATIKWSQISHWQETPDYIFLVFSANGQQGSQIVPKRMTQQKFPIDTLRHHLQEHIGVQGLPTTSALPSQTTSI